MITYSEILHLAAKHYDVSPAEINQILKTPTHPATLRRSSDAGLAGNYRSNSFKPDQIVKLSYELADSMLVEREKTSRSKI